ncbi:MAG: hypothetical protein V9F82_07625 [Dermatophilaceae bacterium]
MAESRDGLKNQEEKNHPADFAIWMKARPQDIMVWKSPWSVGFPGWHLECSAMSTKYLGQTFDIHGGGNDLKFPHHENEVAQSNGACGCSPANYWLHTNMLLLNGKKMSKSDGNTINPPQLFTGESEHITQSLFARWPCAFLCCKRITAAPSISRTTACRQRKKDIKKLMDTYNTLQNLPVDARDFDGSETDTRPGYTRRSSKTPTRAWTMILTPPSHWLALSELGGYVNKLANKQLASGDVAPWVIERLKTVYHTFVFDIFGLKDEEPKEDSGTVEGLMELILDLRANARAQKDWAASDKIRDALAEVGIQVKDGKEGVSWEKN